MKYKDIILEGLLSTPKARPTTDPILAEVLAEARAAKAPDLKATAMKFLGIVKQKVGSKTPPGFGGFEVAWWDMNYQGKKGAVSILYDVPHEVRKFEEYHGHPGQPEAPIELQKKVGAYNTMSVIIHKLVWALNNKKSTTRFSAAGMVAGAGVHMTGNPRHSQ